MIHNKPDDAEIIRVQDYLLSRVLAATERNPITKKFISYNHHRMMAVSMEIEQWLFENKVPEKSIAAPTPTEAPAV